MEIAGPLARRGLEYTGDVRDSTWAILKAWEICDREKDDPAGLGLPLDRADRREVTEIFETCEHLFSRDGVWWDFLPWKSRAEYQRAPRGIWLGSGEYRRDLPRQRENAEEHARQGKIGAAVTFWAHVGRSHAVLGEFAEAREARLRAAAVAERLMEPTIATGFLVVAEDEWRMIMDEGWDRPMENAGPAMRQGGNRAIVDASIARTHARIGCVERALRRLDSLLPVIARAPAWPWGYTRIIYDAAETLWLTERTNHVDLIERNLLEKVIPIDFRYPMSNAQLALARIYALQGRYGEATDWFARARIALDEQSARPERAIVDYDEALMYARRDAPGDRERALRLLNTALTQFRDIGMPGWIRRAEGLLKSCAAGGARAEGHSQ